MERASYKAPESLDERLEILAREVQSAFTTARSYMHLRKSYRSYGYTKKAIQDQINRALGMAVAYDIMAGNHANQSAPVLDTLGLDWKGLRQEFDALK